MRGRWRVDPSPFSRPAGMPRLRIPPLRRSHLYALGILAIALLLAWLMGAFSRRLPPGPAHPGLRAAPDAPRHTVATVRVPRTESAVGTVRAVHEIAVASRVVGRIQMLKVERAGQPVAAGEVLVELESADLEAAVAQARATLQAAIARAEKARADLARTEDLAQRGVSPGTQLEADRATARAADADVDRARQTVTGAESALQFTVIRAPIAGIVVDKKVNQGEVASPGQVLFSIYDPTRLQLVAVVREELAGRLQVGQSVDVTIDALALACEGTVAEIVPEAQARSRTFEVKVVGPCHPGVLTGMFGRLRVPLGDEDQLRVPSVAVQNVGQLDFVYVIGADQTVQRRYVQVGRRVAAVDAVRAEVEVLAGLRSGEVILADAARYEPR